MRSLLAAILSLFLPGRGAHRAHPAPAAAPFPPPPPYHPAPAPARRSRLYLADVIAADGQPLVRPYVVVWERERDDRERWRLQRQRRRAAALGARGQDRFPWEVAV
ncbi:hypothetical protein [Streptomyces muensis]|uniref:Uncharacterized protein n=1 Tax=Streptomyces muensis TaxID=1077944 RepID=A0A9X1Q7A5_STRM4|nr:hypothetical protein [Streptomyces muensis]MCF1599373.1 hypothetical protein [Streptomyces muensis]